MARGAGNTRRCAGSLKCARLADAYPWQLKFVVTQPADVEEIEGMLAQCGTKSPPQSPAHAGRHDGCRAA